MRNLFFGVYLALVCPYVLAQAPSVADRVAQQNALFEEYYPDIAIHILHRNP